MAVGSGSAGLFSDAALLRYNTDKIPMARLVRSASIDARHTPFQLEIRESSIHYRGVFTLEPIPPGRKVIEYTGEKINRRETKRRGKGRVTYLFTLDHYWTLDGSGVGGQRCGDHQPQLQSLSL